MSLSFNLAKYKRGATFVETGTGAGYGIRAALAAGFEVVHSIELDPACYEAAQEAFVAELTAGSVRLHFGDSRAVLPRVLDTIWSPATFWLDSHVDHQVPGATVKCPLYDELEQIAEHWLNDHTIMIDDRRLFAENEARENPNGWGLTVSEREVVRMLERMNSRYEITYETGHVPEDVIIARVRYARHNR
ncbi:MAG: hypothetical protein GY851_35650 [bacterium]|nr:hypothetical protein [bacterium]